MATKIFDLAVATGKYTDKNGQDRTRWENIGEMYRGDNQNIFIMMKPTFNPAGVAREQNSDRIMISCFAPNNNNKKGNANNYQGNNQSQVQQPQQQQPSNGNFSPIDLNAGFPNTGSNTASDFPPF